MKACFNRLAAWLALLAMMTALAGCVTSPAKIWAPRVGNYTYDQALVELGPPDKLARLSDGSTVAEWLTNRGFNYTSVTPGPYGGYPLYGPSYSIVTENRSPDYFLRLIFSPEGRLQTWKQFAR